MEISHAAAWATAIFAVAQGAAVSAQPARATLAARYPVAARRGPDGLPTGADTSTMVEMAAAQVIPENTAVTVRTLEEVSSKTAQVGDPVRMETIDDVIVGGVTVIPAGTPAYGEVTAAQKNGHLGHSGKLTIEVEGVRYGAGRMRLRGSRDNQGSGGGTAALATAALVSPLGLLIKGKSAAVPIHTRFLAYVANDTPVIGATVQPLPVAATPPPPRRRSRR